jgi:hypothetical protein
VVLACVQQERLQHFLKAAALFFAVILKICHLPVVWITVRAFECLWLGSRGGWWGSLHDAGALPLYLQCPGCFPVKSHHEKLGYMRPLVPIEGAERGVEKKHQY